MRNAKSFLHLLAAAMEEQTWEPPNAVPPAERYVQALSGAAPLTEAEKTQLLLSPAARLHFKAARTASAAEARRAIARLGLNLTARRLAADDGAAGRARVQGATFTLLVERDDSDPQNPEWLLVVELATPFAAEVARSGLAVAVRDGGGVTWLVGRPDEAGVLSGVWAETGSPLDRLARHSVHLDIV